jgi:hypothetical protein
MLASPTELSHRYGALLLQQGIASQPRPPYVRWLHYYWDFCIIRPLSPTIERIFRLLMKRFAQRTRQI